VPYPTGGPSKSQANRAGRIVRAALRGEAVDEERLHAALDVLYAFRAAHQYPLTKATMGLRSMVKTEGCRVEVSQRLKRAVTIMNKLYREPTMQLGNMQDIGGCRAVLADIDELRRVERRIRKRRPPVEAYDYVTAPRSSGYRGVHLVVLYDNRRIEVQLRTPAMHAWAIAVERLGGRLQEDLKSGIGPQPVLDLLEAVSEAMALEERDERVDDALTSRIDDLRARAAPWIGGRTSR
jgi:putative GTP pyrophosphokinase